MRKLYVALVATMLLLVAVPATARTKSTCETAYNVRQKVIHRHGRRAPGRNICRQGMRYKFTSSDGTKRWTHRAAKPHEKREYLAALRRLIAPAPPFLVRTAVQPGVPPAGTLSPGLAPTGLADCIVRHESGGSPTASNGQYLGIAQWSPEAWARMGGRRFASTPTGATYSQQLQILSDGLSRFGCRDWCPYDGC